MDNLINVIGVLGAYFVVLTVLSVTVETILEPITLFKGLRKKTNPDDVAKDIKEWITNNPKAQLDVAAITKLSKEINVNENILKLFISQAASASEGSQGASNTNQTTPLPKELLASLSKYQSGLDENKRIIILRILSAIIGLIITVALQLDSFTLLSGLFPKGLPECFLTPMGHNGGILITGISTSAGSSFWHDQIGKLRAAKELAKNK